MASTFFHRFETWRNSLLQRPGLARLDRWSTPHTHPGTSVGRLVIVKIRVLAVFVLRRLAQGGGRKRALRHTRSLRGAAAQKSVLVIGSGPSADTVNSDAVTSAQQRGELLVVATNFFLHSSLAKMITPDFLVWSDDIFCPGNKEQNPTAWELLHQHPGVVLVTPWTWQEELATLQLPHTITHFDDDTLEGWSRNISPLKPRGYQGSTGQKAIAFAVHLGGVQTAIIGIDVSYFRHFSVDRENRLYRHPTHVAGTDTGVAELTPHTLHGIADELYSTANNFRYLHTHFKDCRVVNLDPNSLVDAFPKTSDSPFVTPQSEN